MKLRALKLQALGLALALATAGVTTPPRTLSDAPNTVSRFQGTLKTDEFDELGGLHRLIDPLVYYSALLGRTITVPADFVTDYASIPRLPFVFWLEGGKCNRAAVVHDWLYSTQCVDRATADAVLREAILASGYSGATAAMFYSAVRSFGASHWKLPNQPQQAHVEAAMQAA